MELKSRLPLYHGKSDLRAQHQWTLIISWFLLAQKNQDIIKVHWCWAYLGSCWHKRKYVEEQRPC